jgi:hypothetical protein
MARPIAQLAINPARWHPRRNGRLIQIIVLHSTDIDRVAPQDQYRRYVNALPRAGDTAPHFVVDIDGTTVQCVGLTHTAHHAGISQWAPGGNGWMLQGQACLAPRAMPPPGQLIPSVNCISIGIEMAHIDQRGANWPDDQVRQVGYILALLDLYARRVPPGAAQFGPLSWDSIDGSTGTVVSHASVARQAGPLRPPARGRDDPLGFDWAVLDRMHEEEWTQIRNTDPATVGRILVD